MGGRRYLEFTFGTEMRVGALWGASSNMRTLGLSAVVGTHVHSSSSSSRGYLPTSWVAPVTGPPRPNSQLLQDPALSPAGQQQTPGLLQGPCQSNSGTQPSPCPTTRGLAPAPRHPKNKSKQRDKRLLEDYKIYLEDYKILRY